MSAERQSDTNYGLQSSDIFNIDVHHNLRRDSRPWANIQKIIAKKPLEIPLWNFHQLFRTTRALYGKKYIKFCLDKLTQVRVARLHLLRFFLLIKTTISRCSTQIEHSKSFNLMFYFCFYVQYELRYSSLAVGWSE